MIFFAIAHVNATGRYGMELSPTANPEKEPRHSVAYFERLLSVPRATMSRDIQKLEKIGWIKTEDGNYDTYLSKINAGRETCKDYLNVLKVVNATLKNITILIDN